MKLAVMQPYLFPYIGYFQLIYASHLFLIYDDVSFIKQGYINRNSLLSSNGVTRFTVPVPGASSNKLISELTFSADVSKILKTIEQSYSKAPHFELVFPLIRDVLRSKDRSVSSVCEYSYRRIFHYLGLERQFRKTSELYYDRSEPAGERLIALCRKFGADEYINAAGGRSLYAKSEFEKKGIALKFLDSKLLRYQQNGGDFVPNLSIIDVLMNCEPRVVVEFLSEYTLN